MTLGRRLLLAAALALAALALPPLDRAADAQTALGAIQVKNAHGSAVAVGELVHFKTDGTVEKAQADTAAHAAGSLLVMITSTVNNAYGYATQTPAWVKFCSAPTAGGKAYLSTATAGCASTTAPVDSGTNQRRVLGYVQRVNGTQGLVVGSVDNNPAAAGSTETAVTYSSGLTLSSGVLTSDVLTGKAGGQTWTGGTASGNNLDLRSTAHATKGLSRIGGTTGLVVDEVNGRLGFGVASPLAAIHFVGALRFDTLGSTGLIKNNNASTLSVAVANTDYPHPSATYVTQTATNAPSGAQALGALSSGILGVTTTTGVVASWAATSSRIPFGSGSGGLLTDSSALTWSTGGSGALTLGDGATLVVGTSTGTKIGTATSQKIGFWNATPVVQPSGTGETAGFTAGAGAHVLDDSTFTGNLGSTAYRISDVVKALKQAGLLAQ
jgi:hypothetical protein